MTLVCLGLRPSLHTAMRQVPSLPVSLASLDDKGNHTEPTILRALTRGSAERLAPVLAALSRPASLPGWQLRVLDSNICREARSDWGRCEGTGVRRCQGSPWWCYDPDLGLVMGMVAHEDARACSATIKVRTVLPHPRMLPAD